MKANEILFMQLMEESVIPNKKSIAITTLQYVGGVIGIPINGGCRSCAQSGGVDLLHAYQRLLPEYTRYLVDLESEKILEEIVVADYLPTLTGLPEVGKTETYREADKKRIVTKKKKVIPKKPNRRK